jgi:hypothetical protein
LKIVDFQRIKIVNDKGYDTMNKIIFSIVLCLAIVSCKKDTSPLIFDDLSINFTGQIIDGLYEVQITNNMNKPIWFSGYGKELPVPFYSVSTDTGWYAYTPYWCWTGVYNVQLNNGQSFTYRTGKPNYYYIWNVWNSNLL